MLVSPEMFILRTLHHRRMHGKSEFTQRHMTPWGQRMGYCTFKFYGHLRSCLDCKCKGCLLLHHQLACFYGAGKSTVCYVDLPGSAWMKSTRWSSVVSNSTGRYCVESVRRRCSHWVQVLCWFNVCHRYSAIIYLPRFGLFYFCDSSSTSVDQEHANLSFFDNSFFIFHPLLSSSRHRQFWGVFCCCCCLLSWMKCVQYDYIKSCFVHFGYEEFLQSIILTNTQTKLFQWLRENVKQMAACEYVE